MFLFFMRSNIIKLHRITLVNISALWNFLLLKWNWYDVEYWTILQACCWLVVSNMTSAVIQILDVDLLLIFCRFKCDLRCYPMWYVGLLRIDCFKSDLRYYQNTGCGHVVDWSFQKWHHMLTQIRDVHVSMSLIGCFKCVPRFCLIRDAII